MKAIGASIWTALACAATLGCAVSASAQGAVAESGLPGDVVAVVRGEVLRTRDLDEFWRANDPKSFHALNEQLEKVRRRMLDGMIAERLLHLEAERLHVSLDDLLAAKAKAPPVTADAISRMYDQSSARQQGITLDMASRGIESFLQQQNANEARRMYADVLRVEAKDDVKVYLQPRRFVVNRLPTDPVRGAADAAVEIVEFSDFECPFCARVRPVLDELLRKYARRVRLVWKDLPLPMHGSAVAAASAARCAGDQQKFWEYHDLLFTNQARFARSDLERYALELGLDTEAFARCFDSGRYQRQVQDDGRMATSQGLMATPTIVINGRMFTGVASFAEYERAVLDELERGEPKLSASNEKTSRSRVARGALLGLLIGAGVGVLQGALTVDTNQRVWTPLLAAGWGGIGALVGAFEGSRRP